MIAKVNRHLPALPDDDQFEQMDPVSGPPHVSLLSVLWKRKWTLLLSTILCVAGATAYILLATPIFTPSSSIYIEQTGQKISTDGQDFAARSDSFVFAQAEILKSAPILSAALEKVDYRHMKTFHDVENPIAWLQLEKDFKVEVGKKDDVVTVSLDSPYPQEASDVVNSIVDAYMASRGTRNKTTAGEKLKILQKEQEKREAELASRIDAMRKFKQENGAISFQTDKGNIILERLATLADKLTSIELDIAALKGQYESAKSIVEDPAKIKDFVEDFQTKSGSSGDKEYDALRDEMIRLKITKYTLTQTLGANSQFLTTLQANIAGIEQDIAKKEKAIVQARVTQLGEQLKASQENEAQVRAAFLVQQKAALDLNSKSAEYARLEDQVHLTEKQNGNLDDRIKEVAVNSEEPGSFNIQVLEPARPPDKPSKPRKLLTLAAALVAGMMLGTGLSITREWMDHRIRSLDDVTAAIGIRVLGVVPRILGRKTQVARGQHVHLESTSEAAEAYRTIRTALHFGAREEVKTILVTSPAPGDGKSMTASNLAIAMSQAGHRTLLMDVDLRKPVQHKIFEIDDKVGVSSVAAGRLPLRDAIRPTQIRNLYLLPCGPIPPNPSEIIASKRFEKIMAALAGAFDRIVIDSPPILAVTDGRILAASADATVLVLRTNQSSCKAALLALEALQNVGARVAGTIVNAMPRRRGVYGYYGYYGRPRPHGTPLPAITNGAIESVEYDSVEPEPAEEESAEDESAGAEAEPEALRGPYAEADVIEAGVGGNGHEGRPPRSPHDS